MKITKTLLMTSAVALFSTAALAAETNAASIKGMSDGGQVTLSGTVENFDNAHSFTLRDPSGTVKVDLSNAKPVVLKNGESVEVTGTVDKGIISTAVAAQKVTENKAIGQQIGEAIDSATGQDQAGNARAVTVKSMPESGLVKVSGTVDSVSSEKKFTLKDSTGNIDVNIKGDEGASLKKGSPVTVVGYPNKGILGTSLNATQVKVGSSVED